MTTQILNPPKSLRTGWLFALTVTLVYSFQPILLKVTLNLGVSADDLLVIRLCMASLIFWFMVGIRQQKVTQLPKKAVAWCAVCGLSFVLGMFGYTTALSYTTASVASMIFSVFPIITLIILLFLGEAFTLRKAARVLLGLLGVYLIIGPGGEVSALGIAAALSACVVYSVYLVIMQKQLSQFDGKTIMLYVTSFTALFFLIIKIFGFINFASVTPLAWFLLFIQAFVSTYIAQLLLFSAVKHIGSAQMSLLFPLELFLTILWSVLVLSEKITVIQGLGGAFILFSLVLAIENKGFLRRRLMRPRV